MQPMPSQTRSSSRSANSTLAVLTEPVEAAEAANLCYVTDEDSGIRRERRGKGFTYIGPDGERITDEEEIERIEKIAIPPVWNDVWICPDPNGHLLATGRDAKGRKQYRYHPRWRRVRDETKYNRMLLFSEALPAIRRRVAHDLAKPGMPREKVLALVVRLLEMTLMRVGNDEYARQNRSFGLTTLRDKHVDVSGKKIEFSFKGKSGKRHTVDLEDKRLARVIRQVRSCRLRVFNMWMKKATPRTLTQGCQQLYREITDEDFTAKDFGPGVARYWRREPFRAGTL
jgi:DNA topoisomerase-1